VGCLSRKEKKSGGQQKWLWIRRIIPHIFLPQRRKDAEYCLLFFRTPSALQHLCDKKEASADILVDFSAGNSS
jgi:hypothetical protein